MNEYFGLVSIIMPAYNSEKYIENSIRSVLKQSYRNFELIIIDDCSSDHTLDIVSNFAEQDERIKFFSNPINLGVAKTRNFGVEIASGDWIAFLDSDDLWVDTKLDKQLSYMIESRSLFSFTGLNFIDSSGRKYTKTIRTPKKVTFSSLKWHNYIPCSSVIISKQLMSYVSMENDLMHEDFAAWLAVLKIVRCSVGLNQPLLIYRIHKNSKSANKFKTFKMTFLALRQNRVNVFVSILCVCTHICVSLLKYKDVKWKLFKKKSKMHK